MGLEDLVEKKGGKKQSPARKSKEVTPNYENADKPPVGFTPEPDNVEYHVETKPCPRCACISPVDESGFSWDCPNPDCSVISFTMSWNEWRSKSSSLFLAGVEVKGWEYKA